jgi:hypothetical protein
MVPTSTVTRDPVRTALLRSSYARRGEAVIAVWAQITMASSSNATTSRRFAGASAASS